MNEKDKKKNFVFALIILANVILGILAVITAIRIYQLGRKPIAPSAPASKPKAGAPPCVIRFSIPNITNTPTPTPRATNTPTPTPRTTNTPTPPPCSLTIQGRIYHDRSIQADYRVSNTEEFGPVAFRVDYQPEGQNMIINGGNKACRDSCSPACAANFVNGSFSTGPLNPGKYAIRLYVNNSDWVVSEAYQANGTDCLRNKTGDVAVSGLNTQIAYISSTNYSCGTFNIWFGIKPKTEITPTPTPTPTSRFTPTPTNTPAPGACFSSCQNDNNCDSGLKCLDYSGTKRCLNPSCPTETDCGCNACWDTCTNDWECVSGLSCLVVNNQKRCVNKDCPDKESCTCEITPTSTPKPTLSPGPTAEPTEAIAEELPTQPAQPVTGLKIPALGSILGGFLLISLGLALIF